MGESQSPHIFNPGGLAASAIFTYLEPSSKRDFSNIVGDCMFHDILPFNAWYP